MKKHRCIILLLTIFIIFLFSTEVSADSMSWGEFQSHLCLNHGQPFRTKTGNTGDGHPPARYAKGSGTCKYTYTYYYKEWDDKATQDPETGEYKGGYVEKSKPAEGTYTLTSDDFEIDEIPVTNNFSSGVNGRINVGFGSSTDDLTVGYMLNQGGGYGSALQYWVWNHIGMVQSAMSRRSWQEKK